MCKSIVEGGLRCAAHTRGPFGAATMGTPEWETAAADYAATREGRAVLSAMLDQAVDDGNVEAEVHIAGILNAGQQKRDVAAETAKVVDEASGFGFPQPGELGVPFMSSTPRRGAMNNMRWSGVDWAFGAALASAGIEAETCDEFKVLVSLNVKGWRLQSPKVMVRSKLAGGGWTAQKFTSGVMRLNNALRDVIPLRMPKRTVLQVTGTRDQGDRFILSMQAVTEAQ